MNTAAAIDLSSVSREPLCWPTGRARTPSSRRDRARFDRTCTVAHATQDVLDELRRMGVQDWNVVVSTNVALRRDGLPRSGQSQPEDPGVAVYFRIGQVPHVLACDRWDRGAHHLRAVPLGAGRGQDRDFEQP